MGFLDTIKSFFGGNIEGKIGELLQGLVGQIKPLIEKGEASEVVSNAVAGFGDLGDQLKKILAKMSGATSEAKEKLIVEKDTIVKSVVGKGNELVNAVSGSAEMPDAIKELAEKAKALLAKMK